MTITEPLAGPATPTPDAFVERLFAAANGTFLLFSTYLGERLGWYRALATRGPLDAAGLAAATHTDERYAQEWLEQQVATGIVELDGGRFRLPEAHAEVLTDELSLNHFMPFARFVASRGRHLDELVRAYRTGAGLSWAEMGADAAESQAAANRPMFLRVLGQEYLPQDPELHRRLSRPGARVADIGCGHGWSSIGLALAYPGLRVEGVDVDRASIVAARRNASEAGVADRVRFSEADAAELVTGEPYDAVFAFECIHDLPHPVEVLATMGRLAGDTGAVVVMDERVADELTGPADEVEQLMYGFSLLCCLPDGRAHEHSAATGTVLRPGTLRRLAAEAGLPRFDVLPIDDAFFRFYRLQ